MNIRTQMNYREWLLLILLSVLWGGSFFFNEIALRELSVMVIVAIRLSLGCLALWLVVLILGIAVPAKASLWFKFLIMGLLNNAIPFTLIVFGQISTDSALASIINAFTPMSTALICAAFISDERLTLNKLVGISIGIIGIGVLIDIDFSHNNPNQQTLIAQLALLLATISYGLAAAWGRQFKQMGVSPLVAATGQLSCSALVMIILVVMFDRPDLSSVTISVIMALIGLGVLSTSLAYILYFKILSTSGAINLSLVALLVPASTFCLSLLFLNETIYASDLIALAIIGLGLIVLDGRLLKKLRQVINPLF